MLCLDAWGAANFDCFVWSCLPYFFKIYIYIYIYILGGGDNPLSPSRWEQSGGADFDGFDGFELPGWSKSFLSILLDFEFKIGSGRRVGSIVTPRTSGTLRSRDPALASHRIRGASTRAWETGSTRRPSLVCGLLALCSVFLLLPAAHSSVPAARPQLVATAGGGKVPDLRQSMSKRKREADESAMFSSSAKSAAKRAWLALERDLSKRPGWMVSTDGSSTGWHSAVLAGPPGTHLRLRARWADMKGTRNVGAEASGFLLGIETLPSGIPSCMCLADFLNALAFDAGTANFKHPVLVDVYGRVEAEKSARFPAGLAITHVHHPGHQTDDSYFTWLNRCADSLASLGRDVDVCLPESALEELAAGSKLFAARLEQAEREAGDEGAARTVVEEELPTEAESVGDDSEAESRGATKRAKTVPRKAAEKGAKEGAQEGVRKGVRKGARK